MSGPGAPRAIVVDCDPGIDDALALLYLAADPGAELVAIGTVDGNVSPELGAANTLRVLDVAGLEGVPVAIGSTRPLLQAQRHAEHFHGRDGLGDSALPPSSRSVSSESAVEQLLRLARHRPGELTLLAIGPLTNLALALMVEPALTSLIPEVVVMGGAVACPGNESPWAEFNIAHDPEAAEMVLRAPWAHLRLVGLDATSQAILGKPEVARLAASSHPAAIFATRILAQQMGMNGQFELCDPLAAGLAMDESLAVFRELLVRVELQGQHTRGSTVADRRVDNRPPGDEGRPRVAVAFEVDSERFLSRFMARLLGAP